MISNDLIVCLMKCKNAEEVNLILSRCNNLCNFTQDRRDSFNRKFKFDEKAKELHFRWFYNKVFPWTKICFILGVTSLLTWLLASILIAFGIELFSSHVLFALGTFGFTVCVTCSLLMNLKLYVPRKKLNKLDLASADNIFNDYNNARDDYCFAKVYYDMMSFKDQVALLNSENTKLINTISKYADMLGLDKDDMLKE